jgi:3-hydroxyisobutyrate dehydrogenase
MRKDVRLALELAAATGVELPLSAHVAQLWETARGRISDADDFTRMADHRTQESTRA